MKLDTYFFSAASTEHAKERARAYWRHTLLALDARKIDPRPAYWIRRDTVFQYGFMLPVENCPISLLEAISRTQYPPA